MNPEEGASAAGDERLRRWRLVLGGEAEGSCGSLGDRDHRMDNALDALYGGANGTGAGRTRGNAGGERSAGLQASAPNVARWLGDIREFFPSSVVQVMQRDAVDRLNLRQLLLEPELPAVVPPPQPDHTRMTRERTRAPANLAPEDCVFPIISDPLS